MRKKAVRSKPDAPLSAFSVYSNGSAATKPKRERVESATSLQSSQPELSYTSYSLDMEQTNLSKASVGSTSLIRHISNKAAMLKRRSMRRKKKQKKLMSDDVSGSQWKPSYFPAEACDQSPMVKFSNQRTPVSFVGASRTAKETEHPAPDLKIAPASKDDKLKNNLTANVLFKEADQSVELSTSQSLTGCDDEQDENKESDAKVVKSLSMEGVIRSDAGRPPKKRIRVSDVKVLKSINGQAMNDVTEQEEEDETRLEASGSFPSNELEKSPGAKSNSSSFTTISRKASSVPKMPSPKGNSEKDGAALFDWLIHPFSSNKFFRSIWEKKPLLIRRHIPHYADGLFSSEELNRILNECNVRFSVNLDVTTYQNGARETHNEEGRAYAPVVWDYYKNGCSVRVKNPQAFSKPVWKLCATLQEFFKSMVGANIYLTPAGTQGFAPHYDDIEAFVLQLEGKKQWSLYNPRSKDETLPRYSSTNFEQIEIGEEIFSTVLEPGDLLYFPRGFIHQAKSLPDTHSLHITISTYQKHCWADLFEDLVSNALNSAIATDVEFRQGLPLDCLSVLGVQNSEKNPARRKELIDKARHLLHKLAEHMDVDAAVDERAISFMHDALPPVLSKDEETRTVIGADVRMVAPGRVSSCMCDVNADTRIRLVRKNAVRLSANSDAGANDSDDVRVYHCTQNSRTYHQEEKKFFAIEAECAPAIEYLIHSYPAYVTVSNLPLSSDEAKVVVASSLFEKGIVMTETKVKMVEDPL